MNSPQDIHQKRKISSEATLTRARAVWRDSFTGFSVYDVLHAVGSPLDALLNAHLFWPEFASVEGMTFLPFVVEDDDDRRRIAERLQTLPDKSRVEEEFNCVEVASLFGRRRGETTVAEDEILAEYLVDMWDSKLKADLPSKRFFVRIIAPTEAVGVSVTVYEQR